MSKSSHSAGQPGASRCSVEGTGQDGAHVALYEQLASLAVSLDQLLTAQISGNTDSAHAAGMLAARALACQIGYLADQALDNLLQGQIRGGAEEWLLSPPAVRSLRQMHQRQTPAQSAAGCPQ